MLRARSVTLGIVVYLSLQIIVREARETQTSHITKPVLIYSVLHY